MSSVFASAPCATLLAMIQSRSTLMENVEHGRILCAFSVCWYYAGLEITIGTRSGSDDPCWTNIAIPFLMFRNSWWKDNAGLASDKCVRKTDGLLIVRNDEY